MSLLSHLECGRCGQHYNADERWNVCTSCGKPLLARYDLVRAKDTIDRAMFARRAPTLWRFHELLPVRDALYRFSLGEGCTPLIEATRLSEHIGVSNLFIKDESLNPTTSFKARGLCVALSRAVELGVTAVSIPSAGNAAGALSAYAALAGIEAHVYMPEDVPMPFVSECRALGATITLVDGVITDCAQAAARDNAKHGRFDVSTLKEPYRIEGKKTMGYELAEQMSWQLPDVIIYPTGGGTGLVGMWKAFAEMETMGWIDSRRPRMVSVQSDGCAPIVKAFSDGNDVAEPWTNPKTIADGLRVPAAIGDFLMLQALRESNGTAIAVSDAAMMDGCDLIGKTQGIFAAPEGGATLAAFLRLRDRGWIGDHEATVLFNTGSGHKYAHLWSTR